MAFTINSNSFMPHLSFFSFPLSPLKVGGGGKPKAASTAIGFVALLFCLFGSSGDRRRKHERSAFYNEGLCFLIGIWTINHFLNSFQLIKTVPDRDCWTSGFSFNCLASDSLVGCGHPLRREAQDHSGQRNAGGTSCQPGLRWAGTAPSEDRRDVRLESQIPFDWDFLSSFSSFYLAPVLSSYALESILAPFWPCCFDRLNNHL